MEENSVETVAIALYQDVLHIHEKLQQPGESDQNRGALQGLETKLSGVLEYLAGLECNDPVLMSIRVATYALMAETRVHEAFLETDEHSEQALLKNSLMPARTAINLAQKEENVTFQNFIRSQVANSLSNALMIAKPELRQEILGLLTTCVGEFDTTSSKIQEFRKSGIMYYNTGVLWVNEFGDVKDLNERAYFLEIALKNFETAAECFYQDGNEEFLSRVKNHTSSIKDQISEIRSRPGYYEISEATVKAKAAISPPQPINAPQQPPTPTPVRTTMRQCPVCGKEIGGSGKFCFSCGAPVPVQKIVEKQDLFCPSCHTPLVPGKKFCGNCGVSVIQVPTPQVTVPSSTCPNCGSAFIPGKKFCGKCGTAVSSSMQQPQIKIGNNCPHCGSPVEPGQKFCGICGAKMF